MNSKIPDDIASTRGKKIRNSDESRRKQVLPPSPSQTKVKTSGDAPKNALPTTQSAAKGNPTPSTQQLRSSGESTMSKIKKTPGKLHPAVVAPPPPPTPANRSPKISGEARKSSENPAEALVSPHKRVSETRSTKSKTLKRGAGAKVPGRDSVTKSLKSKGAKSKGRKRADRVPKNANDGNADEASKPKEAPPPQDPVNVRFRPRHRRPRISVWYQTWLLFLKNLQTKQRQQKKEIFFEVVVPIILLGITVYVVRDLGPKSYGQDTETRSTSLNIFRETEQLFHVHVVPQSKFAQDFTKTINKICALLNTTNATFTLYGSEESLEQQYAKSLGVSLALVLPPRFPNIGGRFEYKIRARPERRLPYPVETMGDLSNCRGDDDDCPSDGYFYAKVLALQSLVEQAALDFDLERQGIADDVRMMLSIRDFPKRKYEGEFSLLLRLFVILMVVIALTILINDMLILMVSEKANKVKDGLRMVGVADRAYWCSWFMFYGIIISLIACIYTIVYHFLITRRVNPLILFCLFYLFGASVITFAFSLTPLFHKPKTAGIVGTTVVQFAALLFTLQSLFQSVRYELTPLKLLSSFAFSTALENVFLLENDGGASWSDLTFGGSGEDILISLIFLSGDTVLYALVGVYLDAILPDEFGVTKYPPLICWPKPRKEKFEPEPEPEYPDIYIVEPVDEEFEDRVAIRIKNIKKTYSSRCSKTTVEAVKGISLDIYADQITAILGRNGAGKSTIMNMLTGLIPPTSGSATIFGLDTRKPKHVRRLRQMIGVCLQHDIHFSALTVEEHLEFYGKLRGLTAEEARLETNKLLPKLQLLESIYTRADKLSGGQKRKLSVGMALIGDPPLILLDEPSAGLDPVSRRNLWILLEKRKEDKVILLTTHFMDEADSLADRKAIIHDGVLCCAGSSLFLKSRYGVGYTLTVELTGRGKDVGVCDAIVEKWSPASRKSRVLVSREVKYALPIAEASKFPPLIADIEAEVAKGTFRSFGVALTTLEEVFLRIANDLQPSSNDAGHEQEGLATTSEEIDLLNEQDIGGRRTSGVLWALTLLRIRRLVRSIQYLMWMILLPLILSAAGFYTARQITLVKGFLSVDSPQSIYGNEIRIAVRDTVDTGFGDYLRDNGITVYENYTGDFAQILQVSPVKGCMAAVRVLENSTSSTDSSYRLGAEMSINGTFFHAPPVVLNLLAKFFFSKVQERNPSVQLVTTNFRFEPFGRIEGIDSAEIRLSFVAVGILGLAFVLTCTGLVMEIVRDREIQIRNHLRVAGVPMLYYFMAFFLPFGFIMLLVLMGQLALIFSFRVEAFSNPYALTVLTGLLSLCTVPCMLFSAILACFFSRVKTVEVIYPTIGFWAGILAMMTVMTVDLEGSTRTDRTAPISLHIALSALNIFYVPYAIPYWMLQIYLDVTTLARSDDRDITFATYRRTEIIAMLCTIVVQVPIFVFILIVADLFTANRDPMSAFEGLVLKVETTTKKHRGSIDPEGRVSIPPLQALDEDVVSENYRVQEYFASSKLNEKVVVAIDHLEKTYLDGRRLHRVVNGLNLMVEKGEVFGLLGHNGAGKTTIIRLLTAEEPYDSGRIKLCGYSIRSNVSEAFKSMGYCPQHDALWDNITLKEHIELYAAIRGVPRKRRTALVARFLEGLGISQHAAKYPEQLSGGSKRKLSYAMSMVGAPQLVLMDEPSTGMDPHSRRFLWNTILGSFKETRGAVLTTHSMEEADVLCTRIGILVRGALVCLGSPQHLKNKYGQGYSLELKLRRRVGDSEESSVASGSIAPTDEEDDGDENRGSSSKPIVFGATGRFVPSEFKFVVRYFPHCRLVDSYGSWAAFTIPNEDIHSVSKTFALLEELKNYHNVEDYALSQSTLEQVFLSFAKFSEENEII